MQIDRNVEVACPVVSVLRRGPLESTSHQVTRAGLTLNSSHERLMPSQTICASFTHRE